MTVFLLTLAFMLLVVAAMSIGVIVSGRRLTGSCGGLSSGSCACAEQGLTPPASCPRRGAAEGRGPVPLRRHRDDHGG